MGHDRTKPITKGRREKCVRRTSATNALTSATAARERMKDWGAKFRDALGVPLEELTGDTTPDARALAQGVQKMSWIFEMSAARCAGRERGGVKPAFAANSYM